MKVDVKILGLFSLKTEDMPFWQLLILILIGAAMVMVIIFWLKLYAMPVLGTKGVLSLADMLKARASLFAREISHCKSDKTADQIRQTEASILDATEPRQPNFLGFFFRDLYLDSFSKDFKMNIVTLQPFERFNNLQKF